jgi:hypothetical protein
MANCRSREGGTRKLPFFLVTFQKKAKSAEIFKLTTSSRVIFKVEAYKARNCLTQCFI